MAAEPGRAARPLGGGVDDVRYPGCSVVTTDDRERAAPGMEAEPGDEAGRPIVADPLPRLGVEEDHGRRPVAGRERASVGAERERGELVVAVEDAERSGAAGHERREQAGAGRGRVVESDAGAGEPQRLVEAILAEGLSRRAARASATVAALRAPWRSESAITPATTAAASSTPTPASSVRRRRFVRRWRSASRSLAARLSSRKSRSSSFSSRSCVGRPVERRGEPGAAVELGGVAPGALPLAGGVDQVLVKAPALGVLLEPAAQPRPLAKQRLVGDLDRALVDGHQPALGQHREGAAASSSRSVSSSASGTRLLTGAASSASARRRRIARARSRWGSREAPVGALGEARDGAADAAARLVARLRAGCARCAPPTARAGRSRAAAARRARRRRRRSAPRPARLDPQPRSAGGKLDRAAQLVAAHRSDEHGVGAHLRRKPGYSAQRP